MITPCTITPGRYYITYDLVIKMLADGVDIILLLKIQTGIRPRVVIP